MEVTKAKNENKSVPVFISMNSATFSDSEKEVPKGYRKATPEEIALRYKENSGFRQEIYDKGPTWTSQIGIRKFPEYYKLGEKDEFVRVETREQLKILGAHERIRIESVGLGPVQAQSTVTELELSPIRYSDRKCRVAYVEDTDKQT